MSAAPGPDSRDRKSSSAAENSMFAGLTPGLTPSSSAGTGLSTSQAGPVGPCPEGRSYIEPANAPLCSTDFLDCFGVTNALDPPKPLRYSHYSSSTSSSASTPTRPELPGIRHLFGRASDDRSYYADSDDSSIKSSDNNSVGAHESAAEDDYEIPNEFIDGFIRLSADGRHEQRQSSPDTVSRSEFDSMRLEYLEQLVEQSEEAQMSREKVNALNAELLIQRSELQTATDRLSRIANFLQCSICLETFVQPRSLACGHIFCEECLLQWLARSLKCPMCRAHVPIRPAPAYAIKEVIGLVDPPAAVAAVAADSAFQSSDEAVDPWARFFPMRQRPSMPGLIRNLSIRTPGAETDRHSANARNARPRGEAALLSVLYPIIQAHVQLHLQQLVSRPQAPSLRAVPPLLPPADTRYPHPFASGTTTADSAGAVRGASLRNALAFGITYILRQGRESQDISRQPGIPVANGLSRESQALLWRIGEQILSSMLDVSRPPLPLDSNGTPTPPHLPPRPTRIPAGPFPGPLSSSSSSPRIPIPPPRERPPGRPVRLAANAVPGPLSSASSSMTTQSRLRQPTRFVRPAGAPAAVAVSPAATPAAIRISHIMGGNNHTHAHDDAPDQALLDANRRLAWNIYDLLLVYQRLHELGALETPPNAAGQEVYPDRREASALERAELLFPSSGPTYEAAARDTFAPRVPPRPHMSSELVRPAFHGSSVIGTRVAPTPDERMETVYRLQTAVRHTQRGQHALVSLTRPSIRVAGRGRGQATRSINSEAEDMSIDLSEPD